MKIYLGVSLAAAIVALSGGGSVERVQAASPLIVESAASADMSSAGRVHRVHRSHRHRHHRPRVYVRGPYRRYYERPNYYVPQGQAPFFPFNSGYGLDPSW